MLINTPINGPTEVLSRASHSADRTLLSDLSERPKFFL